MEYHIFIKRGDVRPEIDALLRELGITPEASGMHKYIYASQVNQTVVMISSDTAPLAVALRGRKGWEEPAAGTMN